MCHAHNREVQRHKSNPEYNPAWKRDKGSQHAHTHAHTHTHTYTHTHTHTHVHTHTYTHTYTHTHTHAHTHTHTHTHTHAHTRTHSVHTAGVIIMQNKTILQGAERGLKYRQLVGQCTGLLCLMELLLTNQTTIKMVVQRQMHT